MKTITILGSTGSIGKNTLDVIRRSRDLYRVFALVAGQNVDELVAQILEFRPQVVVVATDETLNRLVSKLKQPGSRKSEWPQLGAGGKARMEAAVAAGVTFVMAAIVGVAGLEATHAAVRAGKTIGLANKELLVASGALLMESAARSGSELIPVDSEHNGAHQCLRAGARSEVLAADPDRLRRSVLEHARRGAGKGDAGTGPESSNMEDGQEDQPGFGHHDEQGLRGDRGLLAVRLRAPEVDVVIHPQSKVHAMVEYVDGSVLAQISTTDMRMPIQYALTYPDRKRGSGAAPAVGRAAQVGVPSAGP